MIISNKRYSRLFIFLVGLTLIVSCKKSENTSEVLVDHPASTFPEVDKGGILNASECGIIGDAKTDNTTLIQQAIDSCAAKEATLVFEKGTYLTRPLFMKSNTTIELEKGAILLGSPNKADYDAV